MGESSDFSALALRIMKARSAGRCEGCGRPDLRLEAHHVQYRSRGGAGTAGNGLLLCGSGNHSGCHGLAHSAEGEVRGWAVRSHDEPSQVPRWAARFSQYVLMTDSGLVIAARGLGCWEHIGSGSAPGCQSCIPAGRVLWEHEEEKGWG